MNGCDWWGPDGRLDTKIDQIDLADLGVSAITLLYSILANKFFKNKKIKKNLLEIFFPL